jgi:DNA-nicking Smr family endonuclease
MDKNKNKSTADEKLFRQAIGDVVPLRSAATTSSKPPVTTKRRPASSTPVEPSRAHDFITVHTDGGHNDSTHRKDGVQKKVLQKLKRGRFGVGDQLDLHQMTTKSGSRALFQFIDQAQNMGFKCVRIIHGKGLRSAHGPRLKIMVRQLLSTHSQVLAYAVCKPGQGGEGAVDVLLKSR